MLLALGLWLGAIVFFATAVAPTTFAVLPTRELAGMVVGRALFILHAMGVTCGLVFLASSLWYSKLRTGWVRILSVLNLLVVLMIALTLLSQFGIARKMNVLRAEMGGIDRAAPDDPRRVEFNALHKWSTRTEGTVLVFGMWAFWKTLRRPIR